MSLTEHFRTAVASGALSATGNLMPGMVGPPLPGDVTELALTGSAEHTAAEAAGAAALSQGEVGVVVLGGGLATRFGGIVKATVPVLDGRSFLEIKLRQAKAAADLYGGAVPVAVMTCWATHEPIRQHVAELGVLRPLLFQQGPELRLTPDGKLFRTSNGEVSPYPTGHGELLDAVVRSGTLSRLRSSGVRHLLISNLDNLLARPNPVVVGQHLLAGRKVTVEVVRPPGEPKSGARMVRLDGRPLLLDSSELGDRADVLPPLPLNTNTFVIDTDVLERDLPLRWLYYEKDIDGRVAVQIERPLHHLTSVLEATFLGVPANRFLPLKTRADLIQCEAVLRAALTDLR